MQVQPKIIMEIPEINFIKIPTVVNIHTGASIWILMLDGNVRTAQKIRDGWNAFLQSGRMTQNGGS